MYFEILGVLFRQVHKQSVTVPQARAGSDSRLNSVIANLVSVRFLFLDDFLLVPLQLVRSIGRLQLPGQSALLLGHYG